MNTLVTLLLQRIRRDRLQPVIWIIGIGLLALFSVSAVEKTYGDPAGRQNILQLAVANPSILMLRGTPEGSGLDQFVFFEIFTFLAAGLFAAQLMRTSRGANGVAAAAVTAAYIFRGIGDALGIPSADHPHMTVAWWSWISPIGWGQQTLAYDENTLTPLLLNLALTVAFLSLVFVLQAQRDSGASLLAGRLRSRGCPQFAIQFARSRMATAMAHNCGGV